MWHPDKGIGRAMCGNRTLIAVQAAVMANLQKQRPVAEISTALDTLPAGNAKLFINAIFKIRVLDKSTLDRSNRTAQILGGGIQLEVITMIITAAKFTIAATGILMNAFHRRRRQNTFLGAAPALHTFVRINLP